MDALLLVDIQNDFMPFGSLPVPDGDTVVPVANALIERFEFTVATQDWHPPGHWSFASTHEGLAPGEVLDSAGVVQMLWPDHCVQGSPGASFHSSLDIAGVSAVVRKGTDPAIDSYSAFFDNARHKATGLEPLLRRARVDRVVVCGLATDYCVKLTALDAVRAGFSVVVVADGCRAVEAHPGDGEAALSEMRAAGCRVVDARTFLGRPGG